MEVHIGIDYIYKKLGNNLSFVCIGKSDLLFQAYRPIASYSSYQAKSRDKLADRANPSLLKISSLIWANLHALCGI